MIRLLLADDENLIRSALASLLALQDDLEVVAQAATGDETLAMARRHHPDVAVLDLQMPGLDGIAVAEALARALPGCASLILTSHGRAGHLKRALAPASAASCRKPSRRRSWPTSCAPCTAGGRYVDPELAADAIAAGASPLTSREADVLELAADGAPVGKSRGVPPSHRARSATTCPRPRPSSVPPTGTRQSRWPGPTAGSKPRGAALRRPARPLTGRRWGQWPAAAGAAVRTVP